MAKFIVEIDGKTVICNDLDDVGAHVKDSATEVLSDSYSRTTGTTSISVKITKMEEYYGGGDD